jgi:hypothetical protein
MDERPSGQPIEAQPGGIEKSPRRLRLPGFINEEVGLGDAVKLATSYIGIKPCAGCERRAAALNRWFTFSR